MGSFQCRCDLVSPQIAVAQSPSMHNLPSTVAPEHSAVLLDLCSISLHAE